VKDRILRFLNDLDTGLVPHANGERLDLYHIGRSALVWKHGFIAATQDVDVVKPQGDERLMALALSLFGKGTGKAKDHGLFLEEVVSAFPPLPAGFRNRATEAAEQWVVIRLFHLDDHDLAVSKLRRFAAKDREDVRNLCDLGLLDPAVLEQRLESALWHIHPKDGDPFRDVPFANLRIVQKYLSDGVWG
jgi:Nucleotidyltransferase of unknown function (DUF6036)